MAFPSDTGCSDLPPAVRHPRRAWTQRRTIALPYVGTEVNKTEVVKIKLKAAPRQKARGGVFFAMKSSFCARPSKTKKAQSANARHILNRGRKGGKINSEPASPFHFACRTEFLHKAGDRIKTDAQSKETRRCSPRSGTVIPVNPIFLRARTTVSRPCRMRSARWASEAKEIFRPPSAK